MSDVKLCAYDCCFTTREANCFKDVGTVINYDEHKHMNEQYLKKLLSEGSEEMIGNELFPLFSEYVLKKSKDEVWTKNFELLQELENIIEHYIDERTRNFYLRNCCVKDAIPSAVVCVKDAIPFAVVCVQYGPLLIELFFQAASQQGKYRDLLERGYFTFKLRDDSLTTVGMDTLAEDTNRIAGHFYRKKQSLQQVIIQSDCIDDLRKEVMNVELNLGIKLQNGDRETKLRMIRALINFDSFKIKEGRVIQNEFDSSNQVNYSSHILKVHWYPTAEELMCRYVIENKDIPLCNLSTISTPDLVLTKEGASLLQKTKQNKSIVINIKSIQSSISNIA